MSYDFSEKIKSILEAVEDEENVDIDPREEDNESIIDKQVDFKLASGAGIDWTGIPSPSPGKSLKDMISKKIKGPPMIEDEDGNVRPADPTISLDDEQKKFVRKYKLPTGKISQKMYDKMDPELQSLYVKTEDEDFYTKKPRESIEKEFIGYLDGEKWKFDDVVSALKNTIVSHARNTSTPNFSVDEGVVAGIKGVLDAWMTDLGRAPFNNHAFSSIKTAIKDGASKAGNVSGKPTSKGGTRLPFSASKSTVSADAPVGPEDEKASFATTIPGRIEAGDEAAKAQMTNRDLITAMVNHPDVGLNDKEKIILLSTYGITRAGEWTDPKSTKEISDAFGISNVRISQIRKKAVEKIKDYISNKGIDIDSAARKFGVSSESKAYFGAIIVVESIKDIIGIEYDMNKQYQDIPVKLCYDGITKHSIARVNTDSMKVDDILYEGDSVLYLADGDVLSEAENKAKAQISNKYFAEMASEIIKIHSQPILGVIGYGVENDDNEDEDDNGDL